MKLYIHALNTVNLYTRSTITEMANIYRVKIKVMDIYHNHMNPVNRFYEIFTISTQSSRLLSKTLYHAKVIKCESEPIKSASKIVGSLRGI